jgi:uncharacterized protein (DUF342 family)
VQLNYQEQILFRSEEGKGAFLTLITGSTKVSQKGMEEFLLSAGVINASLTAIYEALGREGGKEHQVGAAFQIHEHRLDGYVQVQVEDQEARFRVDENLKATGLPLTRLELEYFLKRGGVYYGLDADTLVRFLGNPQYNQWIPAAQGKKPVDGVDAAVEILVDYRQTLANSRLSNGRVNFKSLTQINEVKKGTVILRRKRETPGRPGQSVRGNVLEPVAGKPQEIKAGENTVLNAAGDELTAALDGYLISDQGTFAIGEIYTLDRDVTRATGDVKYSGPVLIRGNVREGCRVDAGGDIIVTGVVEGGSLISRNGSLVVHEGVFGKKKSELTARGDILAKYLQDCTATAENEIVVDNFVMNSQILGHAAIRVLGEGAQVLASELKTYGSLELEGVNGPQQNAPSSLMVLDRDWEQAEKKYRQLSRLIAELKNESLLRENQLKQINRLLVQSRQEASEGIREKVRKDVMALRENKTKFEYLSAQMHKVKARLDYKWTHPGRIAIRGYCYPQTKIVYLNAEKDIERALPRVVFRFVEGNLQSTGYTESEVPNV